MHRFSFLLLFGSAIAVHSSAQSVPSFNNSYISDKKEDVLIRVYGSNKYTRLGISDYSRNDRLLYKPNSSYNAGIGFNYRWLDLNIGFKLPGVNNDDARLGKSKFLDMQAHIYARKLVMDVYGQSYEGYYLANDDIMQIKPVGQPYYLRNDIQTRNIGANVAYVFNNKRFSYHSIFLQNERQLKSAGSFLVGGGAYYQHVRADSSVIPAGIENPAFMGEQQYNRSGIASVVVTAGYAHTFVIAKNFFVSGSIMAGAGGNYTRLINEATSTETGRAGFQYNGIARLGAGYNSDKNYVGVYFVNNLSHSSLPIANGYQEYETGLLRIAVGHRFTVHKKVTRAFDHVAGWFK